MDTARRRRLSRPARTPVAVLALLVLPGLLAGLVLGAAPPADAAPSAPSAQVDQVAQPTARATSDADVVVSLTDVTPVVTSSRGTATIRGRVTTSSGTALPATEVTVVAGPTDISPREWAASDEPSTGDALDRTRLPRVAAGSTATFTLEVDAADLLPGRSWGAAPVSVQLEGVGGVEGVDAPTPVHTFLGVQRAKEYEPLRMLWGVPVTLPPDRSLAGVPGADRAAAWEEAVGEDSRVARLTAQEPDDGEVWFLDPTLLGSPPTGATALDESALDRERSVRSARAETVRDRLDPASTVVLPDADADVAAAAGDESAAELVGPQVRSAQDLADDLGAKGALAWPADDVVAADRLGAYADLYGDEEPTVVVPSTALPQLAGRDAPHRTEGGAGLLVADATLSDVAGGVTGPESGLLARQRVVAETAEVLGQAPGTGRTMLVLPPRGTTPDPGAYADLREASADVPWLTTTSLDATLEEVDATTPVPVPQTVEEAEGARAGDEPPPSPVDTRRADRLSGDVAAMSTFASVRADGPVWSRLLRPSLGQLTSARWRGHEWAWLRASSDLRREVTLQRDDLTVTSGAVNFFADSGRLQITVENHGDVELRYLRVRLDPGNRILRVDAQPEPVTIAAGSAQTVSVQATALAAGNVPIDLEVTSPDGRVLTAPARLDARVRPTGDWIYWALGGVAALLFAAGAWRTVRSRGDRPATATVAKGADA